MKNVLCFVLFTFTLALSQENLYAYKRGTGQSRPQTKHTPGLVTVSSTEDALTELTQADMPITQRRDKDFLSPYCRTLDMVSKFLLINNARRCDFQRTCYVVGFPLNNTLSVHVISKDTEYEVAPPGSQQFVNLIKFQAVILPFIENENTYMILEPERAPWFFTDMLGGCDIFVATAQNQGNKPLVIHANRNLCDDQAKNLKTKGDSVNTMLANINGNYSVIARVYYKPGNPPELVQQVEAYVIQYQKKHQGIRLLPYNNCGGTTEEQEFYFFGQYVIIPQPARWRFYLKGMKDGSLLEFDVSEQGSVMN